MTVDKHFPQTTHFVAMFDKGVWITNFALCICKVIGRDALRLANGKLALVWSTSVVPINFLPCGMVETNVV